MKTTSKFLVIDRLSNTQLQFFLSVLMLFANQKDTWHPVCDQAPFVLPKKNSEIFRHFRTKAMYYLYYFCQEGNPPSLQKRTLNSAGEIRH